MTQKYDQAKIEWLEAQNERLLEDNEYLRGRIRELAEKIEILERKLYGEEEAVMMTIDFANTYGYGNLIALLRAAWRDQLMDKWNFSEEAANTATMVDPYPRKV